MTFWDTQISYLKGVGPQKAEVLQKELRIFNYRDLIQHYPFRYLDRTKFYFIRDIDSEETYVQLKGVLVNKQILGEGRVKRLVVLFRDEKGDQMDLVWFQGIKFIEKNIQLGKEYIIFGKANIFNGRPSLPHPELELMSETKKEFQTSLQPMYSSTEKLKSFFLDSKGLSRLTNQLLLQGFEHIDENLPVPIVNKYRFILHRDALAQIHFPINQEYLQAAQRRLKFEEFFFIQLKMLFNKHKNKALVHGFMFSKVGDFFNNFYNNHLPFELTNAQKRVLKEIRKDVCSGFQMNRLVQGDVGSGKTVVALLSMLIATDNGFQCCMMAPTEILANQHYEGISDLVKNMDIKVALLTGSSKKKERDNIASDLLSGELNILIGTHALIEDKVKFKNLGLAIVDEQHRFGVEQRAKLWKKNTTPPHILVMTATPIPRTLAMTLYGDLDVSVIDELPAGRKPIITSHRFESNRLQVNGFLKQQISLGRQVYIVYPLIEESEKLDYLDLMNGYENIIQTFPMPQYQVSIVHGKMKPAEKNKEMERFKDGDTQIMVATTVIEVGVNVPNASVMVIENAEKFGLSQLHQLRGRVGRGAEQSYCILMSGNKLSADGKTRLQTMVDSTDGFEISEVDLKLRGPGDLAGTAQSGILDFKIADLAKDQIILQEARKCVEEIIAIDPNLESTENRMLWHFLHRNKSYINSYEKIS